MFKLKITYVLFLAIAMSSFGTCSSMSIEGLFGGADNMSLDDETQNTELINKTLTQEFIVKHFYPSLKYSKKQIALLCTPAVLTIIAASIINFQYQKGYFDVAITSFDQHLPENENVKSAIYPVIPTALISSILLIISKTEPGIGIHLTKSEKAIFVAFIYFICFIMLKFNAKNLIESLADWKIERFIKTYLKPLIIPLMLSVIPTLFANNLINSYNLNEALLKFLDNYNSDKEKNGRAYEKQAAKIAQGVEIAKADKITVKNNKLITPDCLREAFDKIYDDYRPTEMTMYAFNVDGAVKELLAKLKECKVSIE
ncbi:MAG: hypothetical protein US49_C0001G0264 [candidate division TM6 bacterium GW2011_GWF2_37_49]|nr:MAG: hypothetical protein US49_C0001G0264 [candidate division TM6 bacterium GW2011_GWF2_37_49]